ncbi:GTPase-activating protein and VPS9 domain-containing protein 1 [Neocloeon triangulifer]|uniref:GTPase-activating protein and VPS9 domain-containing protein 1 n=1 Tax=Neocloeon triangulifer TaxID=2078957 RepID=UPI00286EF8DB|nr:GTPase-activating protein and VPS9 domain-containing protein 1 [Neocloeon triangulifer]
MSPIEWDDLLDLAERLVKERFFVDNEQKQLQQLNEKVCHASSKLAQQTWIAGQVRANLSRLIHQGCKSTVCCHRLNQLENISFIDARKRLGFVESQNYGIFLHSLRNSPQLLASCLAEAEKIGALTPPLLGPMAHTLVGGLFGGCILAEDERLILKLLRELLYLQVAPHQEPSRMLRPASCTFSRLYAVWHEGLFTAKLFLTGALYGPILKLLSDDDVYLDADPAKMLLRFTPEASALKFGNSGTPEFEDATKRYRLWLINRLNAALNSFIEGIQTNMFLFPHPVKWIVRQLHILLTESSQIDQKQVCIMCTDLVFGSFICPAIVNPELYGITDLPTSDIARFNLMQVAQILQRLAIWQWQEVDSKVLDLYSQFDKNCLWSIMEEILEGNNETLEDEAEKSTSLSGLARASVVLTENELHSLVHLLRSVSNSNTGNVDDKALSRLLSLLPPSSHKISDFKDSKRSSANPALLQPSSSGHSQKQNERGKNKVSRAYSNPHGELNGVDDKADDDEPSNSPDEVLVIPFGNETYEYVGLLPENKFLEHNAPNMAVCMDSQGNQAHSHEKRTRFSLSHDEGSIVSAGNVSDNLEAVSEAASNHSAASSLDIEEGEENEEDQPDNLSDMVSANVSGRGTPSISGRDTPSSQVTESEEMANVNQVQPRVMPESNRPSAQLGELAGPPGAPSTMPTPKQHSRTDIDDKFGKFEIKKLIEGDETFSLVSDTWSTDVLASDSEMVEHSSENNFPVGHPIAMLHQSARANDQNIPSVGMLDVSETASEAWSTDVMASDSERMGEVDTDDAGSVARSDDVGRSEIDGENNRDTPPLAAALSFRPIRMELPVLRECPAPVVVPPKVSFPAPNSSPLRNNNDLYLPPSPPSSVTAGEQREEGAEGESKLKPDNKARMLSSSTRSEDSTDSKQTNCSIGLDVETVASPVPRLSTTSLASSSSSSMGAGSDARGQSNTPVLQENSVEVRADSSLSNKTTTNIPSSSTGAIPKSISFDKTAERGDRDQDDEAKNKRGSFFRNIKLPFKSRTRKSTRSSHDDRGNPDNNDAVFRNRRKGEENNIMDSEEILAKYRRKPGGQASCLRQDSKEGRENGIDEDEGEDEHLQIDPQHPELSYAFADAKRKLRLVLSIVDAEGVGRKVLDRRNSRCRASEKLTMLLKLLLTEAMSMQDEGLIAQIQEALRCVLLFDDAGCRKLIQSLKDDYFKRAPYIAYITRSKTGLLTTYSSIKKLVERIRREKAGCGRYLIKMCIRLYLEQREDILHDFESNFQQLTMPDEKTELLYTFLEELASEMERDALWRITNESRLDIARQIVEQTVISRVYMNALYPNGEGDISRDQVLHEHMKHLSEIITLNHKDMRIPKSFQYECPWPSAQAKISVLNACKTPKDKVQCVVDCAKTIMRLLELAHNQSTPAADDFTPVLVYVLIKANPPSLLSTVQYVNNFYGSQLSGEEEYWWVQFCSAIEYIKTMD